MQLKNLNNFVELVEQQCEVAEENGRFLLQVEMNIATLEQLDEVLMQSANFPNLQVKTSNGYIIDIIVNNSLEDYEVEFITTKIGNWK